MAEWKTFMREEGYKKFEEARCLGEVNSKDDPEDEPYMSKYKAREIIYEIKQTLKKYAENDNSEFSLPILMACVDLKLATNYIDTEELSTGEELLNNCLDKIEKMKHTHDGVNIYQHTLNQLGILWTGRRDNEKALDFFKQAEDLYKDYRHKVGTAPKCFDEYFKDENEKEETLILYREKNFENTYTHTLYYMAQVYAKLDEKERAASCCHMTLERQLESRVYDPIDWSLNAATLSQYYISCDDLVQARHCMASSEFIFREMARIDDQDDETKKELYHKAQADIQRCWIKYGLALLESSRDYWMSQSNMPDESEEENSQMPRTPEDSQSQDAEAAGDTKTPLVDTEHSSHNHNIDVEETNDTSHSHNHNADVDGSAEVAHSSNSVAGDSAELREDHPKSFRFNLELTDLENQITDKRIHVFEEAKKVFLKIQKWLSSSKEFYSLSDYCTDNIELVQDSSKAYKLLSFYELSMDRQCKMHKRRVDMLSLLLAELNPQYYLLLCRQLMFEIADIYSEMLDLKLAIMESEGSTPTPHAVKKINLLAQESIASYQAYVDSLKGGKNDLPEQFGETDVRPALVAFFCMGRLYSKFIFPETMQRIAFTRKSLECYKFLVDYCNKYPNAKQVVSSELSICEELVSLLPLKMEKMRQQAEI